MKPREYMEGLRRCAARMERAAGEISIAAQQGLVPDAAVLDELRNARNELEQLRGALNALLARLRAEWADSATLTLDQLEERVDEWELRERIGAGIAGRISDAAERLERLHAPSCGLTPVRELARQAAKALEACDMQKLSGLEDQAMPYLDMCVLLSGDIDAVRRDGELLMRLENWYPQVVWYVRARMKLQQDAVRFDEISDSTVDKLKRSRLDPRVEQKLSTSREACDAEFERISMAVSDERDVERIPHNSAESRIKRKSGSAAGGAAHPGAQSAAGVNTHNASGGSMPQSGTQHGSHTTASDSVDIRNCATRCDGMNAERRTRMIGEVNLGIYSEVARRMGASSRAGVSVVDLRALASDYPELPALKELAARRESCDARADGYAELERLAQAQAQALDEIIEDARAYLAYSVNVRPENAALARAWAALMTPGRGTIFGALESVATRRRGNYEQVSALCGRLMIDGLPNGLRLQRLGELAPDLNGERLVELLRLLMPGMLVLGRWRALLTGEIARRMGRVQVERSDGGELRLNEQYAPSNGYRRAGGRVWRLSGARPGVFNRRK